MARAESPAGAGDYGNATLESVLPVLPVLPVLRHG